MNIKVSKYSTRLLDYELVQENIDETLDKEVRSAVRAISLKGNKILVVYPKNEVLYGTPGGGIDGTEEKEEALLRELKEETGANGVTIIKQLGTIKERRLSIYADRIFTPDMNYFLVDIKEFNEPELLEYEKELELTCKYIDIDEVIRHNEQVLKDSENPFSPFYYFQTELFKLIKKELQL